MYACLLEPLPSPHHSNPAVAGKNLWQELDPHDFGVSSRAALRAVLLHSPGLASAPTDSPLSDTAAAAALASAGEHDRQRHWEPWRLELVSAAWDVLSAALRVGRGAAKQQHHREAAAAAAPELRLDDLISLFHGEAHPDVRARLLPSAAGAAARLRDAFECYILPAILTHAQQQQRQPTTVPFAAWLDYYAHVSAATDSDTEFAAALCGPWRLVEGVRGGGGTLLARGSAAAEAILAADARLRSGVAGRPALPAQPPTHIAVLVSHADGRRSVARIVSDAFLAEASGAHGAAPPEAVLLARLAAAGIADAVGASLDF